MVAQETIIVVEDEIPTAMYLSELLSSDGYHVPAYATNARDAIRLAERYKPSLALMDIRLDDGDDGIDVARQLRFEMGIPSIFITACREDATETQAELTRPLDFLFKPINDNDLCECVAQAIRKSKAEKLVATVRAEGGEFEFKLGKFANVKQSFALTAMQQSVYRAIDEIALFMTRNPFLDDDPTMGIKNESLDVFTRLVERKPIRLTCEVVGRQVQVTDLQVF